jgi:hypothetical protein
MPSEKQTKSYMNPPKPESAHNILSLSKKVKNLNLLIGCMSLA